MKVCGLKVVQRVRGYLLYLSLLTEFFLLFLFGFVLLLLLLHSLTVLRNRTQRQCDQKKAAQETPKANVVFESIKYILTISEWKAICLASPMLSQIYNT